MNMRVYEIFVAELGTYVKFKVLPPQEIELFIQELGESTRDDFVKKVLEFVVFNMKTEIIESLKMMSRPAARETLEALFNGCVMLNPGIDIETWLTLAYSSLFEDTEPTPEDLKDMFKTQNDEIKGELVVSSTKRMKAKKLTKGKFLNLQKHLEERVIGQNEAIRYVVNALKRSQVGLNDEGRPLGVFLFAGSSGVGKTHLARELHKYLYGEENDIVRLDCGEYQHKHDNQKLTGSPPGYVGHDDGGQLANAVRANPDTVVLLDEVEKAHPDIWNTFLRVFDEGILTDSKGRKIDFRNTVIIMTTNLGNDQVVAHLTKAGIGFGARLETALATKVIPAREHIERIVHKEVKTRFRPEFLNRIDQTVIFNYLSSDDYIKIAELEVQKIEEKLSKRGILLKWDERVLDLLIDNGVDSVRGARGMSRVRREQIEDLLADKMINSRIVRGTIIELNVINDKFTVGIINPPQQKKDKEEETQDA